MFPKSNNQLQLNAVSKGSGYCQVIKLVHSDSLPMQVGLWISAGSRYESEKNNGAGFLLEHMAFKVSTH